MELKSDILVVGSGIAGLFLAVQLAEKYPQKKILVLTKTETEESNTKYAQGGIATVSNFSQDSYEKHIQDTLIAGDGLCNTDCVNYVVRNAQKAIEYLIKIGVVFDKNKEGQFDLSKEGGHSENRILHYKDMTGQEITNKLLKVAVQYKNIEIKDHYFAIDIITQHHLGFLITKSSFDIYCYGIYALDLDTKSVIKILSNHTILATGGGGQVYRTTTNPTIACGDGVAMFYRAKGRVENMEFVQFHPTALVEKNISPSFLITEAIRGKGAILRNSKRKNFMKDYDSRAELAPRDIVARAIDYEMKKDGTEFVYLDCTNLNREEWQIHFPNILEKCLSIGINPEKDYLPVAPAAHYVCGGIKTDLHGNSSIKNLYACGECASTGLHGANRLASNSLLEALVFSQNIAENIIIKNHPIHNNTPFPDWHSESTTKPKEMILITQSKKELQSIMSDYVGIVRNNIRLSRAMKRIDLLYEETEKLYTSTIISPQLCELRNMITLGYLIVKSAQFRKESRGLHYNTDYPTKSPSIQNIIL